MSDGGTRAPDVGVGLIGYGLGGRAFHAPYIDAVPGLALRAVVSRDPAKVHADRPDARVVPSVDALLGEPGIDLVVVSSPDALHADHARAALRAGKHVLVDKPFATTLADAVDVAQLAERVGRTVTAFQNRRWDADFRTLRALLSTGMLGEVVEFESRFDRWRPVPAAVWKEEREGGIWFDLGPHLVDQALVLFGRPETVSADIATLRPGAVAPDHVHVVLRYPGRRVVLHAGKLVRDHRLRFAVQGTRGSWIRHGIDPQEQAVLAGRAPGGDDWGLDPEVGTLTVDGDARPVPAERGDYRLFWQALAAAVRGEGPSPVPAADAVAVMEILDAGLRSSAEGRAIILGPSPLA